jgi:hypothetical protein
MPTPAASESGSTNSTTFHNVQGEYINRIFKIHRRIEESLLSQRLMYPSQIYPSRKDLGFPLRY